ncbi:oxidoreductase [Amylocystis lapponica]|nr:oxidoreductase [Amylocystis lapponica]
MPKVVLVTGCTKGGIGFALCEEFAAQGCKVYATARRLEAMEGFTHEGIVCLKLDVTSDEEVQSVVDHIVAEDGKIDVVVNNAGAGCTGPLMDIPIERIIKTFDANTFSGVRLAQKAFPHMAARKSGTIVNIGSIMGETPTPWSGVYSGSKAAIGLFSDALYMECRPFNVAVMLVVPGAVRSNIAANTYAEFSLPPGSFYTPWLDSIVSRISASQEQGAIPAEELAHRVVRGALSRSPPRYMTLGGRSGLFAWFKWLPRGWVLRFLWKTVAGSKKAKA